MAKAIESFDAHNFFAHTTIVSESICIKTMAEISSDWKGRARSDYEMKVFRSATEILFDTPSDDFLCVKLK